ncbi:hypothetical protein BABINDRAFT_159671 [Babjeviella inositovora NRRL Y-12698]|uniref:PH domain-containing protein n=1 Tax=Babjeviella inositovora NRRL Y-12698 TaxID=984486 RepID=A0A1E3R099_9ASCO|nr:uncharacterized protein BABINDRAFT_159671 [Babjeviella inositovora NRRL Y-12698]ODQ83234.1 hypothetical protein BABINDRAFT_159671 [Babjeviella inositovora NRRL Y-12698]
MSKQDSLAPNNLSHSMSMLSQNNQYQLYQLQKQQQQQQQRTKSIRSTADVTENTSTVAATGSSSVKDVRSPLYLQLPVNSNPTEILAARFNSWRSIIKALVNYLREVVSVHEEIVRQQLRLQHAVNFPFVSNSRPKQSSGHGAAQQDVQYQESLLTTKFFLPFGNGSVQDLPSILTQYHSKNVSNASKTLKELSQLVIPRLEDLRKDLLVKIKEIKNLASDFKNDLSVQVNETKNLLSQYQTAIDTCSKNPANLLPTMDPFLIHSQLEQHLEAQITEENFLHDAYINLQTSGKELEKIVVIEIQNALTAYAKALGMEAQAVFDILITKLDSGLLTKEPQFEWDAFVAKDSNFIDPNLPSRAFAQIAYNNMHNPLNLEVRSSYLERRSKFLKSYSRGWYVLTSNYIHEFKSPDRKKNPIPIMSLSLYDCSVAEHSSASSSGGTFKFVLHAKQNGIIHRGHNWVFRVDSYDTMIAWYNDLKQLTSLPNPVARSQLMKDRGASEQRPDGSVAPVPPNTVTNRLTAPTIREGTSSASGTIRSDSMNSKLEYMNLSDTPLQYVSTGAQPHLPNRNSLPPSESLRGDYHRKDDGVIAVPLTDSHNDEYQQYYHAHHSQQELYPNPVRGSQQPYPDTLVSNAPREPHFQARDFSREVNDRDNLLSTEVDKSFQSHSQVSQFQDTQFNSDHSEADLDHSYRNTLQTESSFHRSTATAATMATTADQSSLGLTPVSSPTGYDKKASTKVPRILDPQEQYLY